MNTIDLRSDTVTKPGDEMRGAMAAARVGDDVYGEDVTVNALEASAAQILGKEAAVFCTSGTQSNLLALFSLCRRGDEYIVGQHAHTYRYEAGGGAVLASIQPQPLTLEADGTMDLEKAAAYIKPDDCHFAKTRLLCLENTHMGKVLPLNYMAAAGRFVKAHELKLHLDGARVFNAAAALEVDVKKITCHADTVSCCLSKGLGAPVGSVLAGPEDVIQTARRWRKMLGGGMRQAGILAAAGIYALEHHVERLKQDHENAALLADGLAEIKGVSVVPETIRTNMVFARMEADMEHLAQYMEERQIMIDRSNPVRLVTHLDITREDISRVLDKFFSYFHKNRQ